MLNIWVIVEFIVFFSCDIEVWNWYWQIGNCLSDPTRLEDKVITAEWIYIQMLKFLPARIVVDLAVQGSCQELKASVILYEIYLTITF